MAFKKRNQKAPKRFQKRKVVRKPSSRVKTINTLVKKALYKQVETKQSNSIPLAYAFNALNTTMSPSVNLTTYLNSMIQGVNNGQRIGNEINISKAVLNINLTASFSATVPQVVSVFIGYIKGMRNTAPDAAFLATINDRGGSTSGYTGLTQDLLGKINTDRFSLVKYTFKMGLSSGTSPTGAIFGANNDFKLFQNKKIPLKAIMGKFQFSNDQNTGINRPLYMWCQYTSVSSAASSDPPTLNYYVDVDYKDI